MIYELISGFCTINRLCVELDFSVREKKLIQNSLVLIPAILTCKVSIYLHLQVSLPSEQGI